ncbi:L-aspartate dehydrogenase [Hartmannibacter diazotrophicus]|uniref:L-aspartate dehydrogenase n=1 Tax=Hartmannibacter diazotrophicus TaxID=1482074 RepID=A0A2C9D6C6_9HYPH|nr:aspartate dehydrogenase [Hartmannibacter diazotrophicus]SON55698.1 L-aspartate dehydrogenase [Hartmannibacter diazotrophicus]
MTAALAVRPQEETRVAIAGLGAIGVGLCKALHDGIAGFRLTAVSARDLDAARERLAYLGPSVAFVPIAELEGLADIVIECAPAALLPEIVGPFVKAGKTAFVLSCAALLGNSELVDLAEAHGGRIIVPSGAILGLDAVNAAAQGKIESVRMVTRKPVTGLKGAPFLVEQNITIDEITEPLRIFKGTARQAAVGFPANLNVAVALSLAGIGPDRTELEIWADPSLKRNVHNIQVKADSAEFEMTIENIPSDNPKTGRITALSVISALKKMKAPLRIGG